MAWRGKPQIWPGKMKHAAPSAVDPVDANSQAAKRVVVGKI